MNRSLVAWAGVGIVIAAGAALLAFAEPLALLAVPALIFAVYLLQARPAVVLVLLIFLRCLGDARFIPAQAGFAVNLGIAAVAVLVGLRFALIGRRPGHSRLAWWLIAFVLIWTIVAVVTFGFDQSVLNESFRALSILTMVFIARAAVAESGWQRVGALLTWWLLPIVALLLIATVLQTPLMYSVFTGRAFGTFGHQNAAALFVAFYAVLALFMLFRTGQKRYLFAFVVAVLGAAATVSIGGTTALAAGVLVLVLMSRNLSGLFRATIMVLIVGAFIAVASTGVFSERLAGLETTNLSLTSGEESTNSLDWRILNWSRLLAYFVERPLAGWGYGTTNAIIIPMGKQPHSEYVKLLVETGIIGFTFAVICFLAVLIYTLRKSRTIEQRWGRGLGLALLAIVATSAIAANTISTVTAMYLLVSIWAVADVQMRHEDPAEAARRRSRARGRARGSQARTRAVRMRR